MSEEKLSIKHIFNDFFKVFYVPELADFIEELDEPLEGKSLDEINKIIDEVKKKLTAKVDQMTQDSGHDLKTVDRHMSNQDNFSRREWEAIEGLQSKIEDYRKDFQIACQGAGIREIVKEGRRRVSKKKNKLQRYDSKNKKWLSM